MQAGSYDFVIISYNLVGKLLGPLQEANYQFVTLDESHFIKDSKVRHLLTTIVLVARLKLPVENSQLCR